MRSGSVVIDDAPNVRQIEGMDEESVRVGPAVIPDVDAPRVAVLEQGPVPAGGGAGLAGLTCLAASVRRIGGRSRPKRAGSELTGLISPM